MRGQRERAESDLRATTTTTTTTTGVFTPIALQMIPVGEKSGAIHYSMNEGTKLAISTPTNIDTGIKKPGPQIKPIMISFVGLMVLAPRALLPA